MSLQDKYQGVLDLGLEYNVKDGYVNEENGVLKFGGTAEYQYQKDKMWDKIKEIGGEVPTDVEADIKVENTEFYGTYTVVSGDTLGKISKQFYGKSSQYMAIAKASNISNPDRISIGQHLNIPFI
ncbi:MAG: LysM peptidoglycan-binding domain-containing protein [Cyclobacteriaceae bacterium]